MTYKELLDSAEARLSELGLDVSVAKFMLMGTTDLHSYQLISMLDEQAQAKVVAKYEEAIDLYVSGKPLQYILGYEEFFARRFYVDETVLIPRFETEELVENVLYRIDDFFGTSREISLVDIGTGSGIIGVTLKLESPEWQVIATDYSQEALDTAKKNAKALGADVTFMQGDMLEPLIANNLKFDCIISNPPYIPETEVVQDIVLNNEPHVALFGGADGTYFYERILEKAHLILNPKAFLGFEIGDQHSSKLIQLANHYLPNFDVEIVKDLQGKERMMFLTSK